MNDDQRRAEATTDTTTDTTDMTTDGAVEGAVDGVEDTTADAAAVGTGSASITEFLDRLCLPEPDPGGGAVSALLAGLSAGLVGMVAGYGKETDDPHRAARMTEHLLTAERLRLDAPRLADLDAEASAGFAPAYALPQGDERREETRARAIRAASITGAESAAALGARAASLVPVIEELAGETGMFLSADVGVAATVLASSLRGAAITLAEDLGLAGADGRERADLLDALDSLDRSADALDGVVRRVRLSLQ